jgi:hypothetical protein
LTPILLASGILSRIIIGMGIIVVIKFATVLTIPQANVSLPSSRHFAPSIAGKAQNACIGLHSVSYKIRTASLWN